jgi:hypothetical protein
VRDGNSRRGHDDGAGSPGRRNRAARPKQKGSTPVQRTGVLLRAAGGRPYLTGLYRARSAVLLAALISSAAPSMWTATSSAGMPL